MKKHLSPDQRKARDIARLKVLYYIEEVLILTCTLVGVVSASAIGKRKSGIPIGSGDFLLDWYNLLISAIMALGYYGGLYTQWKDFAKTKPPIFKRIGTALLVGAGCKAVINF